MKPTKTKSNLKLPNLPAHIFLPPLSHTKKNTQNMEKENNRKPKLWHRFSAKKVTMRCSFLVVFILLFIFLHKPSSSPTSKSPIQRIVKETYSIIHPKPSSASPASLERVVFNTEHIWKNDVLNSVTPRGSINDHHKVVLVTGAAGFVGTHVSLALKRRGDSVVGLDNFNRYYDPKLKRSRQDLLLNEGVYVVEGDINDMALLNRLFDTVRFTHVMHLAAQAGVRYAMKNPSSYINSNIAGFVSLLEVCKSSNPKPAIVWASSSSVYGLNTKLPFSEEDRTDQPASLYAATKKADEEIAHSYNHIYGLSLTGLRFFTVYGPWGRPDMAYFEFTKNILKGKNITVFQGPGGISVGRDFTYIDDVVKGCIAALDTAGKSIGREGKRKGLKAPLRVFNIGNTSPESVEKLVGILERLLKKKARRDVQEMPKNGDVMFTHANISLATRELGYKPTTDLETGLKKFVEWYVDWIQRD